MRIRFEQVCGRLAHRHWLGTILLCGSLVAVVLAWCKATPVRAASADDGAETHSVTASDPLWAFQPLRSVTAPSPNNESWCRTPVDRFILAKLQERGIKPNPPVDRRRVIRRAYFDLIGLPPTPEEVERFINDPAADAYERLIDQLLDNPAYGERWGRHWLDLARFAESHGYEQDYDRPNAYHYRDFVIKALNQDMPYDQFVQWQIAGDEFAPDDPLALMGTGFLAAGTHATQITANQAEKERYDELDDIVRTIGTSMLGLTIGCARCHDHKYDPITSSEYYGLISTFATTVRSDYDVILDPKAYRAAQAEYDAEHAPLVAELEKFERDQLAARFIEYRKSHPDLLQEAPWVLLEPVEAKSAGGATFTLLDDGSRLVGGANPDQDTYTFVISTKLQGIRAIRVEALSDPSLPHGGPGRAANGNFGLADFRVTAATLVTPSAAGESAGADGNGATKGAQPHPVKLTNARSSFDQSGLPVTHAIDDKKDTCWAVDPQFGKDHRAMFDFESPIANDGGTKLIVTMEFKCNKQHGMGRPRLAVTASEHAPIDGQPITEAAIQALSHLNADSEAALNDEQQAAVLKWYRNLDPQWQRLNSIVQEHAARAPKPNLAKALICSEGVPAVRLHTQGLDFYDPIYQLKRGDPNQKGEVATPSFLHVLMRSDVAAKHWQESPPPGCRTTYRRRALANWLVDVDEGAGHLLARVIVNRLWYYHMGRGIVATPSDFGKQGGRPSHPELLDWMARDFVQHGWRLKYLHKLIMTSAVYMQSNAVDDVRIAADRDNSLFWHRPGRRLEAEVIRDSMLATSGSLDATMFGAGTLDPKHRRRSIYFFVKRSQLVPMMTLFDGPDTLQDLPCRVSTTIAPQALMLLNNVSVRDYAAGLVRRVRVEQAPADALVRSAFLLALSRPPSDDELSAAVDFLAKQTAAYEKDSHADPGDLALIDFCQALLCLNEYVYVE